MKLFRSEVIEAQRRRLWGDVRLSHPPTLTVWTGVIALVCCTAFASLIFISFTRRETVSGELAPIGGVVQIAAPRNGVIAHVDVDEGEHVDADAQLFDLADVSSSVVGGSVVGQQLSQVTDQKAAIDARRRAVRGSVAAERERLHIQITGTHAAITRIDASIAVQADVAKLAALDLDRLNGLQNSGYAPKSEVDRRRRQSLIDKAALIELEGERERLVTTLGDLRSQIGALSAKEIGDFASIDSDEGSLAQRRAELELVRGQSVRASVSGVVSYQAAQVGQMVQAGQPLAAIIPDGAPLEAHVFVPTKSAGFLRIGQKVRLRIQAFPYQRFGFVEGEIGAIARSVSAPNDPASLPGLKEPVYRVRVRLMHQTINANGAKQGLQPGMALTADIETDRRRLWQQLFDPLIAAGRLAGG